MPSVLIELGYLTNYEEAMKLNSRQWEYANAIYLGLLSYFGLQPV
jgi:N-acetylmuramoyl-L-alanine amidase